MSDLLSRLKAGKSAIARVKIGDVEFGLRVLTEQDYLEAGFAAEAAMKAAKVELTISTADLYEDEKASQLLVRALVDPESKKPVTDAARALREAIGRDERSYLTEQYLAHEKEFSPSGRSLSDDDFALLIEDVKKNPETPRLNGLSFAMLKRLITALACPAVN